MAKPVSKKEFEKSRGTWLKPKRYEVLLSQAEEYESSRRQDAVAKPDEKWKTLKECENCLNTDIGQLESKTQTSFKKWLGKELLSTLIIAAVAFLGNAFTPFSPFYFIFYGLVTLVAVDVGYLGIFKAIQLKHRKKTLKQLKKIRDNNMKEVYERLNKESLSKYETKDRAKQKTEVKEQSAIVYNPATQDKNEVPQTKEKYVLEIYTPRRQGVKTDSSLIPKTKDGKRITREEFVEALKELNFDKNSTVQQMCDIMNVYDKPEVQIRITNPKTLKVKKIDVKSKEELVTALKYWQTKWIEAEDVNKEGYVQTV